MGFFDNLKGNAKELADKAAAKARASCISDTILDFVEDFRCVAHVFSLAPNSARWIVYHHQRV